MTREDREQIYKSLKRQVDELFVKPEQKLLEAPKEQPDRFTARPRWVNRKP